MRNNNRQTPIKVCSATVIAALTAVTVAAESHGKESDWCWAGTYLPQGQEGQRNLTKLVIGQSHTKTSDYYKVQAWLTGTTEFPTEAVSIENGTVESYMDLDLFPKTAEDTIVASFPTAKDRPIIVITRGPSFGKHFKYINVTFYWSTLASGRDGHNAFYIKRRLYRQQNSSE